ncbi:MAG: hypothetical protein K0Q59_2105 [Paenibacillus sp.]|nr:hypothetical protein [Paenibacillus sp.]
MLGGVGAMDLGIKVFWFSKEEYMSHQNQIIHSHPFFHYIYVLSGNATILVGAESFEAQSNELYLTPVAVTHSIYRIEKEPLKVIEIKFEAHEPALFSQLMQLPYRIQCSGFKIRRLLESLVSEGLSKEMYYSEIIHMRVMEALYLAIRGVSDRPAADENASVEETSERLDIRQAADYLDENLNQPITLEMLAKECKMSKHYFCRCFKSSYGISPIQYLNKKRLDRARELMLYSSLNITQISAKVGFADVHYFSRIFKKVENVTPQEYMKKRKPNLYFVL